MVQFANGQDSCIVLSRLNKINQSNSINSNMDNQEQSNQQDIVEANHHKGEGEDEFVEVSNTDSLKLGSEGSQQQQQKSTSTIDDVIPMDSIKNGMNQAWSSLSWGLGAAKVSYLFLPFLFYYCY